jgi:hypothetical protein
VQLVAILGTAVGIALISRPQFIFGGGGVSSPMGYVSGTLSSVAGGIQYVIFRRARDVNTLHFMLWAQVCMVVFCPVMVFMLPGQSVSAPAGPAGAVWLALQAVLLTAATFLYVYASKRVPAATAAVLSTSEVMWGYVLQVAAFGAMPAGHTVVGGVVLLSSTVAIVTCGADRSIRPMAPLAAGAVEVEMPATIRYSNVNSDEGESGEGEDLRGTIGEGVRAAQGASPWDQSKKGRQPPRQLPRIEEMDLGGQA